MNLGFPDTEDLYQLGIEAGQFTFKKASAPLHIQDSALYKLALKNENTKTK